MSISNVLASLSTAASVVAPVAIAAPVVPSVSFRFWVSKEPQMATKLVADIYAVKCPGYVEALFAALESVAIPYRTKGFPLLIKVYSAGTRVNVRTIGHPLARVAPESITQWLDRVSMDASVKGIGIEVDSAVLTKAQVRHLHVNLAPCKFNAETTAFLVGSFTAIPKPNIAPEAKQFKRTAAPIEHMESVPLPVLKVPAGHVEPAAPTVHVEYVGDTRVVTDDYGTYVETPKAAPVVRMTDEDGSYVEYGTHVTSYVDGVLVEPEFAIEPMVPVEMPPVDESVVIIEEELLEARTIRELGVIFKSEFGCYAPSKIRKSDLILLIEAKRDASF